MLARFKVPLSWKELAARTVKAISSGAMVSIITTLNAAYDITEERPLWRVRLTAIGLTLGMSFFILVSMALVLVGPTLAEHLAGTMHLGEAFKWTWWILQWPIVFV